MTATLILGASGYVGGELLRLVSGHPELQLAGALSRGSAGRPIADEFPHLGLAYPKSCFAAPAEAAKLVAQAPRVALFSALPHGESNALAEVWQSLEDAGFEVVVVDLSADFRLGTPAAWEAVYRQAHPAPELHERFFSGLPDLSELPNQRAVAHPGCFTTAVTLGAAAFVALGAFEPRIQAACVTGSTGSGRSPKAATHHPERHGNFRAYGALTHRHRHEMEDLLGRLGERPEILFSPHSGPFARGMHATLFLRAHDEWSTDEANDHLRQFFATMPFVDVTSAPPAVKDVVCSNRCLVHAAANGHDVVVHSVIDNLTKGAAGGGVQWMNRLLGLDETAGLLAPAPGWS